jgi:hypothetical protein
VTAIGLDTFYRRYNEHRFGDLHEFVAPDVVKPDRRRAPDRRTPHGHGNAR